MRKRNAALARALEENGVDAIFLLKQANQRYLEGFTGADCFLIASAKGGTLIADSRYAEMAAGQVQSAEVRPHRPPHPPLGDVVASWAREKGAARIAFEKDIVPWGLYEDLHAALQGHDVALVPTVSLVEGIRAKKNPEEAAMVGAACQIADRALWDMLPCVGKGVSELDLKIELDYRLKTGGAEDVSFDTMVLFGARASQPHAVSQGDVRLRPGDFILIDYGAVKNGYHSDTSRTFVFGKASDEQKAAYEAVLRAQLEGVAAVAPGANGRTLNARAVETIENAGFPAFQYGIGHGVGLEIHEEPFVRQNRDTLLEAGMILTIEPGTYKPGWGGIRIEDTVIVTDDGCEILTHFPKELMEL